MRIECDMTRKQESSAGNMQEKKREAEIETKINLEVDALNKVRM
jgi:hypothetical protein